MERNQELIRLAKERKRRRNAEELFKRLPPEFFMWIKQEVKKEILKELLQKLREQVRVGGGAGGGMSQASADARYLQLTGGTLTGNLITEHILPSADSSKHIGELGNEYDYARVDSVLSILGSFSSSISTDLILEYSAGAGVTIDSVALKDGGATLIATLQVCDGVSVKFEHDVAQKTYSAGGGQLGVVNKAGGSFRNIRAAEAMLSGMRPSTTATFNFKEFGGTVVATINSTNDELNILRGGEFTMLDQKMMTIGTYTDAQRPAAGTAGRIIFNTDDGMPNYDDGANWRDINGNIT